MNKSWTKEEDDVLRQNYPSGGIRSCLHLNRTQKAIQARVHMLKIKFSNVFSITKESVDKIINSVSNEGKTVSQFAKEYGVSLSTMILKIKEYYPDIYLKGLSKSKNVNHNYFDELNEENSYFIGLIFTDGTIEHVKNKQIKIEIELQARDKHILDSFCECICSKSKVRPRKQIRGDGYQLMYRFVICSDQIGNKLAELGIVPRKSKTIKIPEVFFQRKDLFWHFLRGAFDGDGSIHYVNSESKNKRFRCNFYGNKYKCEQLSKFLKEEYSLTSGKFFKSGNCNNGYAVNLANGNKQVQRLYHLLYKDAKFFMRRKHDKFVECLIQDNLRPFTSTYVQEESQNLVQVENFSTQEIQPF